MRASDLLLEPVKKYRTSINPPYKRKDLISILGTLFILLAIPLTVFVAVKVRPWGPRAAGTAASPTTIGSVIEPGSMVSGASYIVFVEGTNYYAKNGKTGEIQFSGTDAAAVINAAIVALPETGGKVMLAEGKFVIQTPIIIENKAVHLQGQGPGWAHADNEGPGTGYPLAGATIITAENSYNNEFITVRTNPKTEANIIRTGGTTISDLKIYQDFPDKSPLAHGIHTHGDVDLDWVMTIFIHDVSISGVGGMGIYVESADTILHSLTVRGTYDMGIAIVRGDNIMTNVIAAGNGRKGADNILLQGWVTASNIYSYGGGRNGIYIQGPADSANLSNFMVDAPSQNCISVWPGAKNVNISNGSLRNCGMAKLGDGYQSGILVAQAERVSISNISIYNFSPIVIQQGITLFQTKEVTIDGVNISGSLREAIKIRGSTGTIIKGCQLVNSSQESNNTYSDILLTDGILPGISTLHSTDNRIFGCNFRTRDNPAKKPKYGIEEADANQDGNRYHDNTFDESGSVGAIRILGAGSQAYQNKGYVTENSGTATNVADGGTINHGLAATPSYVQATPSVAGEIVSVTAKNDTSFTVAIKKPNGSPGTTQTIYWRAELK